MNTAHFYPAKIVQYHAQNRTAQVAIQGLTDGTDGIVARLAYPIGDDDKDTERLLVAGADVWVFFEMGDIYAPIIAFYRSHGTGAVVDTRRIRQQNIELLANQNITLTAQTMNLTAQNLTIKGDITVQGNITQTGTIRTDGLTASGDVVGGGKSLIGHTHAVLSKDFGTTSPAM